VKVGKDDVREEGKAKLLEVGLELKVLRMENNIENMAQWAVIVDNKEKTIEGGIREAVKMGLVAGQNWLHWWGFEKKDNGDVLGLYVLDESGYYGKQDVVYGEMVDDEAVPVEEGLFAWQVGIY